MPDEQIPPLSNVSVMLGPTLSEHVIESLGLSGDFRDRMIVEVAAEVDNLENDRRLLTRPAVKAQVSTRRVKAIQAMHNMVVDRDEKDARESAVVLVAALMRHVRDTLRELSIEPEMVQTILTTLMAKVTMDSRQQPRALS